jgi:hypothetical protein
MDVRLSRFAVAAILSAAFAGPAQTADMYAPEPAGSWRVLDEVRGGVYGHAVDDGAPEEGSIDLNLELLTSRLAGSTAWYVPRLHLGGVFNTDDDTSHVYGGFTWNFDLGERFFLEATFGGAVHNGDTGSEQDAPDGENALGCSPLFRESLSLGYRLSENWSVMGTVEHLSNADLCDANRGLTNAGGRIGYKF